MLLSKTKEHSQFYRFHTNSQIASNIFNTTSKPCIGDKQISVLQVAYVEDKTYNIIIEFEYIEKEIK